MGQSIRFQRLWASYAQAAHRPSEKQEPGAFDGAEIGIDLVGRIAAA